MSFIGLAPGSSVPIEQSGAGLRVRSLLGVFVALCAASAALLTVASPAHALSITCNQAGIGCISPFGYTGGSVWGYPVDGAGNNCTNYAAFRLAQNGAANPGNLGNAGSWGSAAQAKGFAVNGTPAVGAVAWFGYGHAWAPSTGHVAYVDAVNGNQITLSDSNWQGGSKRWSVSLGEWAWPTGFIHIKHGGGVGEGSFVSQVGSPMVYRIAGGAPIYVSNWSNVGGPQPVTVLSAQQFGQLRSRPVDGTLVASGPDGRVYRIAGGAPIYVSSWDAIGGPKPAIGIDQWAVDNPENPAAHLNRYPADGTVIASSGDGRVYRVAGGAPIYVSNWDAIGGPQPAVGIDKWAVDNADNPYSHLRSLPLDGTVIASSGDGRVYRVAGGAPTYVSNWDAVGGPQPAVGIDKWAIDNADNPYSHLKSLPLDGTLVSTSGDGRVYRIVGGAPLHVSNWPAIGGAQPAVGIDKWAVDNPGDPHAHIRAWPLDGRFVNTSTGVVYRFAGGAAFQVTSWSLFGGVQPSTRIDQWPIDNAGNPISRVRSAPVDGTIVRGLPSQQHWAFAAGLRSPSIGSPSAIAVDDAALSKYAQPAPPPPKPTNAGSPQGTPQTGVGGQTKSSAPAPSRTSRPSSSCRSARSAVTRARVRMRAARTRARRAGNRGRAQRMYKQRLRTYRSAVAVERSYCS